MHDASDKRKREPASLLSNPGGREEPLIFFHWGEYTVIAQKRTPRKRLPKAGRCRKSLTFRMRWILCISHLSSFFPSSGENPVLCTIGIPTRKFNENHTFFICVKEATVSLPVTQFLCRLQQQLALSGYTFHSAIDRNS